MKCIPGDYLMKLVERMPKVYKTDIKAKGGYFEEAKIKYIFIYFFEHFCGYYMIPYVLFHSVVFSIIP